MFGQSNAIGMLGNFMLSDHVESKIRKVHAADRIGGSLVNIILGALILWVGQTTFRHAGQLASVDERFDSIGHQFDAVNSRHEGLRRRLEQETSETNERTRSRFTREDGDKLAEYLKELAAIQGTLERRLTDRVTNLHLKLTALETHGSNYQEVAALRAEVSRLSGQAYRYGTPTNYRPIELPAVTQRR